jgi:hypothetical protein
MGMVVLANPRGESIDAWEGYPRGATLSIVAGLTFSCRTLRFCSVRVLAFLRKLKPPPSVRGELDVLNFARALICGGEGFALARGFPQRDVGAQVEHHFLELNEVEGLGAVADGFFWGGMHFHD